jgi:Lipocalin-like domain
MFLILHNQGEHKMNRRNIISLSVLAALTLTSLTGSAVAQQKSVKGQLVGTWSATSWEQTNKDGTKFQRFGANPKGVNMFDANGRFFVMFARADLPKNGSNDPMKTTSEENKAVVEGTIAYFGTYAVDEAGKTITLRIEASSFPNQVGSEQKRTITSLTANELKMGNPTALSGGQITYVMKRASTLASN